MKYQSHSETSFEAAERIEPSAGTLRAEVYSIIFAGGFEGATDEEVCDALDMGGSTQRPRRVELMESGFVMDSQRRRRTRSQRWAVIWVATHHPDVRRVYFGEAA